MDKKLEEYIEIKEIKDIQLLLKYILEYFHVKCEEKKLIYNVFGGTLLGAVRHKGFIPWDDDIDVVMPRDDYNKFYSLFKDSEEFVIRSFHDDNYPYPYMKLCLKDSILVEEDICDKYNKIGAYIDIFPVDGYPKFDTLFFIYLHFFEKKRYSAVVTEKKLRKISNKYIYWIKLILRKIYQKIGIKTFLKKEVNLLSSNDIKDNNHLLQYAVGINKKGYIEKNEFYDRNKYQFENLLVYGVKNYDKQLTYLYGDYMKLPSEEDRKKSHNNKIYLSKSLYKKIKELNS